MAVARAKGVMPGRWRCRISWGTVMREVDGGEISGNEARRRGWPFASDEAVGRRRK